MFEGVVEQENNTKSLKQYPIECFYNSEYCYNFTSSLHWHFYSEIIYVHEGEHEVTVEDHLVHIKKGDVLYINPQRIHIARMNSREKTALSVIKFDPELLFFRENKEERKMFAPFLEQSKFDYLLFPCTDCEEIEQLFLELRSLGAQDGFAKEYEIKNVLCRLMIGLFYKGQEKYGSIMESSSHEEHDELLYNAVRYINCQFENEIKTEDILRLCGMSYSYFAKKFKQYTGKTLIQYINHVRIAKAQRLLGSGELSIIDVATSCGFNDASYFVRVFKQLLGKTPSEYRNSV